MEIKVGEYVRTKRGIAQIIDLVCGQDAYFDTENIFETNDIDFYRNNGIDIYGSIFRDLVVKHSKQLIDLVEAGDLVYYTIKGLEHSTYIDIVSEHTDARTLEKKLRVRIYKLEQLNIKKILTKEQINENIFKVVE